MTRTAADLYVFPFWSQAWAMIVCSPGEICTAVLTWGEAAWKAIAPSTYSWVVLMITDPATEVVTWVGELTVAPSPGEVIDTSAPALGAGEEELPLDVPAELLPELEPEPEDGGVAVLLPAAEEFTVEDALARLADL